MTAKKQELKIEKEMQDSPFLEQVRRKCVNQAWFRKRRVYLRAQYFFVASQQACHLVSLFSISRRSLPCET